MHEMGSNKTGSFTFLSFTFHRVRLNRFKISELPDFSMTLKSQSQLFPGKISNKSIEMDQRTSRSVGTVVHSLCDPNVTDVVKEKLTGLSLVIMQFDMVN